MTLSEIYRGVFDTLRGRWLASFCVLFVWTLAYWGVAIFSEMLHWLIVPVVTWSMIGIIVYSISNMFLRLSRDKEASVFSVAWLGFGSAGRTTLFGISLGWRYFIFWVVLAVIVIFFGILMRANPILSGVVLLVFVTFAGGWLWSSYALSPYYLHDRPDLGAENAIRQAHNDIRGYRLQLIKCDLPIFFAMIVLSLLPLAWVFSSFVDDVKSAKALGLESAAVQEEAYDNGRRLSYDDLNAMDVEGIQKGAFAREMLALGQQGEMLSPEVVHDGDVGQLEALLQPLTALGVSKRSLRMLGVYVIYMFLMNTLGMMLILAVHAEFYRRLTMDGGASDGGGAGVGHLGGGFEPDGGPRRGTSIDLDRRAALDLDSYVGLDGGQVDDVQVPEDTSDEWLPPGAVLGGEQGPSSSGAVHGKGSSRDGIDPGFRIKF